jgi:hypothetical protein
VALSRNVLGTGATFDHDPPLKFAFATDIKLPHIWASPANSATRTRSVTRPSPGCCERRCSRCATPRSGSRWLDDRDAARHPARPRPVPNERILPLVVASQTIPIIAIAPLIVIGSRPTVRRRDRVDVPDFFPVTIAALRGLRAFDPARWS